MLFIQGLFLFGVSANLVKSKSIPITGLTSGINAERGAAPIRRNINELEAQGGPTWYINFYYSK